MSANLYKSSVSVAADFPIVLRVPSISSIERTPMPAKLHSVILILFSILFVTLFLIPAGLSAQCGGALPLVPAQPAQPIQPASLIQGLTAPTQVPIIIIGEDGQPVIFEPSETDAIPQTSSTSKEAVNENDSFKSAIENLSLSNKTAEQLIQAKQKLILEPELVPDENAKISEKVEYLKVLINASDWEAMAALIATEEDCDHCLDAVIRKLAPIDQSSTPQDILRLLALRTSTLDRETLQSLGQLLKRARTKGSTAHLVRKLDEGLPFIGGSDSETRGMACELLIEAGLHQETLGFMAPLPEDDTAPADLKYRHAVYHVAVVTDSNSSELNRRNSSILAADLLTEIFSNATIKSELRTRSLTAFLELLPNLDEEWKQNWFSTAFSAQTGSVNLLVLRLIEQHALLSKNRNVPAADLLKVLRSLHEIASKLVLLESGSDQRTDLFNNIAQVYIIEMNKSLGTSNRATGMGRRNSSIELPDLARICPDTAWLAAVSPGIRQPLANKSIQVLANQDDPKKALAFVTYSCTDNSMDPNELSAGLIESWSKNLDPNRPDEDFFERRFITSSGVYYPNMMGQASAPLTRSKQRRSLKQLAEVLLEFKKLGLEDLDWPGLVNAFTVSHSRAEVYRNEDIERIFGPIADLDPEISIELARSLWKRLQRNWRDPSVQKAAGTRRTTKEIQQEVERGYSLGQILCESALNKVEESWNARVISANLFFDLGEFWRELDPDLERYIPQREAAFSNYLEASTLYVDQLKLGKQSTSSLLFLQWFTTALGASELSFLTVTTSPENDQVLKIIEVFDSLDPLQKFAHIEQFSSAVEGAIARVPADLRSRFVRHAMRIIRNHPAGTGTKRLALLYDDLESEVEFHCQIDGSSDVGTDPFGLHLSLRYTDALDRESKGFDIYLRNQVYIPLAQQPMDYKDDLEGRIREAFSEHFEIVAIQFNDPDFKPYSFNRPGWMEKSFAYIIMEAKDASVDLIPEVRIDLDFEDGTNGSVRIPVTSPVIPIVASTESIPRPTHGTQQVEMTLDDRELEKGYLSLEILADGLGVIPPLDVLVPGLNQAFADSGFIPAEADALLDNGLNITEMHDDLLTSVATASPIVAKTERSWTLRFNQDNSTSTKANFSFPPVSSGTQRVCKKYTDFDIVELDSSQVTLQVTKASSWLWWTFFASLLALGTGWLFLRKPVEEFSDSLKVELPSQLSGLSLVHFLRQLESKQLIDIDLLNELHADIQLIESTHFSQHPAEDMENPSLETIGEKWRNRANA